MKNRAEQAILLAVIILGASATLAAAATRPVPWRPRAWQPPTHATAPAALRSDPEDGSVPSDLSDLSGLADEFARRRRALAEVPVETRLDGSRFARVGGFARRYTVARIDEDGTLVQDCVQTEAEAKRRVATPVPAKGR